MIVSSITQCRGIAAAGLGFEDILVQNQHCRSPTEKRKRSRAERYRNSGDVEEKRSKKFRDSKQRKTRG